MKVVFKNEIGFLPLVPDSTNDLSCFNHALDKACSNFKSSLLGAAELEICISKKQIVSKVKVSEEKILKSLEEIKLLLSSFSSED